MQHQLYQLPAVRALPRFHLDPPEITYQTVLLFHEEFDLKKKTQK